MPTFETAERAERYRDELAPRLEVFKVVGLDEMGLAEVLTEDSHSRVAWVPADEREEVAVYELEAA